MARTFAQVVGVVYLLVGLLGFVPAVVSPYTGPDLVVDSGRGVVLGLFPINVLHNVVHLAIGAWGIASARTIGSAVSFARSLAVFYGLLAVMGLIPGLNTTFGLIPIHGNDVWLHALTALVAAYVGWGVPNARDVGVR